MRELLETLSRLLGMHRADITFMSAVPLTLLLTSFSHVMSTPSLCPVGCFCQDLDGGSFVQCSGVTTPNLLDALPESTAQMALEHAALGELANGTFARFLLLRYLVLTECSIRDIMPGAFIGLNGLEGLDLKHNKINVVRTHAFAGLFNLRRLELDYNDILRIEDQAFSGIGRNTMGIAISLQNNPNLQDISPRAFSDSRIEELLISNSRLLSTALQSIQPLKNSLHSLFIKYNQIPLEIPTELFIGFNHLKLVDFAGNSLQNVQFLEYLSTECLSLSDNPIGPTNFSNFPSLNSIRDLYLENTGFVELHGSYFNSLTNLQKIHLAYNHIVNIPDDMLPFFSNLQGISLRGNPLHCNCDLAWLHSFVRRKTRSFSLGASCSTPHVGNVFDLAPEDFVCYPPTEPILKTLYVDRKPSLECKTKGDPPPSITWRLPNGWTISVDAPRTYQPETIAVLSLQDKEGEGLYTCFAQNRLGNQTSSLYVDTHGMLHVKSSAVHPVNYNSCIMSVLCLICISLIDLISYVNHT